MSCPIRSSSTVPTLADELVRPAVQQLEHANTCFEALIKQMRQQGVFGRAVPEECRASRASAGAAS
uniref:acyl-CoA dehydrogenase family protein n=1 Tax=Streptomyces zhihengii TaxID=1818004 RepID=UPI0035583CBF